MSSDWITQFPALATSWALLVLPGLGAAYLLRMRGVMLLGGAVIGSLASIGAASLAAPMLGMSWSLLPVLLCATLITLVAAAIRLAGRGSVAVIRGNHRGSVWVAIALAVIGWMLIVMLGIKDPSHPTQLYDGLFHLNAVEFILQTGDASPLHMTMAIPAATSTFYPTLWHALVALVVPVSGSVVVATNAVTIAVVSLIWPTALAALASVLFRAHATAATWAPLVAFGFSVFPLGFLNWGVLYPNLLGTVQIPLLIALVILAFRRELQGMGRIGAILLAVAAVATTALGHPSALLAAVALLLPYPLACAVPLWHKARTSGRVVLAVAGFALVGVVCAIWAVANVTTDEWLPTMTMAQSLGEVAFLSPVGRTAGLLIGPLSLLGAWILVKQRHVWPLISYGIAIGLYLAAAWFPILPIRSALVGVWYDDTTRVGALLGMIGLPLAALGAARVVEWMRERAKRRSSIALLAVLGIAGATHLIAVANDISYMRNVSFRFDNESQGLSSDEAKLFAKAESLLAKDSVVIGDPLTGAALLYAYTGHHVVFPHVTGQYGPDAAILARSLSTGGAQMCTAINDLGVTHALDFGDRELFENHYTTYDGLHDLADSELLTPVARVGEAVLYKVTGCR